MNFAVAILPILAIIVGSNAQISTTISSSEVQTTTEISSINTESTAHVSPTTTVKVTAKPIPKTPGHYKAAVIEAGYRFGDLTLEEGTERAFRMLQDYVLEAKKQDVDIILTPEYFLTTQDFDDDEYETKEGAAEIPEVEDNTNMCGANYTAENWATKIMQNISCLAKAQKMYIGINVLEIKPAKNNSKADDEIFNTNVVFDRNGNIIAKYRKFNLYDEDSLTAPPEPKLVTFTTDFGVTFGTFICFDLLFAKPAKQLIEHTNATDILYTTAWISEYPFFTAIPLQAGWARANGVNLLAAGLFNPVKSGWGSGLYSAKDGIVEQSLSSNNSGMPGLIVGELPILKSRVPQNYVYQNEKKLVVHDRNYTEFVWADPNFKFYTVENITKNVDNHTVCHGNFCCQFTVEFLNNKTQDHYLMVAFNGTRSFGKAELHLHLCAVTACLNEANCGKMSDKNISTVFEKIIVSGDFVGRSDSTQFPSILKKNFSPMPYSGYKYSAQEHNGTIMTNLSLVEADDDILCFSVLNFNGAPKYSGNSSACSLTFAPIILLISFCIRFIW